MRLISHLINRRWEPVGTGKHADFAWKEYLRKAGKLRIFMKHSAEVLWKKRDVCSEASLLRVAYMSLLHWDRYQWF